MKEVAAPVLKDDNVKHICVLGVTGSVGQSTLAVVAEHPQRFAVTAMTANSDGAALLEQARLVRPQLAVLAQEEAAAAWRPRFEQLGIELQSGTEGLLAAARHPAVDVVVAAITGIAGLPPVLAAIEAGKDVALANKEALVAAGPIVMAAVRRQGVRLLPVDSEHNALFQCIQGLRPEEVASVILTASGGPFFGWSRQRLAQVTPEQALQHPTWSMGAKITIDSATLMNKGLEVIEAMHLFNLDPGQIKVLVHPESAVHCLVQTIDGGTLAHLAQPDMRHPIQYSLSYPQRWVGGLQPLDLAALGSLNFAPPDLEAFPALDLAWQAARAGQTMPAVLNGANEIAVEAFLAGRIGFLDIPRLVAAAMANHELATAESLEQVLAADGWARQFVRQQLAKEAGDRG